MSEGLYWQFDDIIYDGEELVFKKLVFWASLLAITFLNIDSKLVADPYVAFYPTSQAPGVLASFLAEYRVCFDLLIPYFEASSYSPVPSPTASDSE